MDLTDIWQEHKKFILAAVGTALVLLIGRGWVSAQYDWGAVQRKSSSTSRRLRSAEEVKSGQVATLRAEVEELRERLDTLAEELNFRPEELFVLADGHPNPTSHCWSTIRSLQDVLVDEAERLDINIPEKLGLEDAAPTDPEDIRRTLRALNVIKNVVLSCMDSRVRYIQRIRIEEESRSRSRSAVFVQELRVEFEIVGTERAVRSVLGSLVEGARSGEIPFLEVSDPTSIVPHKTERDMMLLRLSVAALDIANEEREEA